jgi:hypothetical protein
MVRPTLVCEVEYTGLTAGELTSSVFAHFLVARRESPN